MADKRIKNWDAQSERLAGLKIAIDHADFNEAKTILASILCPTTDELTESIGTLNKTGTYVRINVGAVELKALLSDVVPNIIDFTLASSFNATQPNHVHFYVGGTVAANYVISIDNFATALFARAAFLARVLALEIIDGLTALGVEPLNNADLFRVYNESDGSDKKVRWEDLINDLVATVLFTNAAKAANTEAVINAKILSKQTDFVLKTAIGSATYATFSGVMISNVVHFTLGNFTDTGTSPDDYKECTYTPLPAAWRPVSFYEFGNSIVNAGNGIPENYAGLTTAGIFTLKFDDIYGSRISGTYLTATS